MGLFDFFKKRSANRSSPQPDDNNYVLQVFQSKLAALGFTAEQQPGILALLVNGEVEIATAIIEHPGAHPYMIHLLVLAIHPVYFPAGIQENIAGVGATIEEKANTVADNFINTTFLPIIDSFSDSHDPALDFMAVVNFKEVLWHPKMGALSFQGKWDNPPQGEPLFDLLKFHFYRVLTNNKLNWIKIYISKQADGTIIGECNFNNEPWQEGLALITQYAKSWPVTGDFVGMKQFIMFRKCDAYDTVV